jgi:hypothetical protein
MMMKSMASACCPAAGGMQRATRNACANGAKSESEPGALPRIWNSSARICGASLQHRLARNRGDQLRTVSGSYELRGVTRGRRVLSALLTRTASFCISRCASSSIFPKQPVSYCISCSQRVYWPLPLNPHVSSTKSYAKV